jgi:beta-lactam-binding protein with PASTA domain
MWNAGFGYTVETVQSNDPIDRVVSTDPEAGTSLDPNSRTVTIRRSAGPPPPPPPQPAPQPVAVKDDGNPKNDGKKKDEAKDEGKGKNQSKGKDQSKGKNKDSK